MRGDFEVAFLQSRTISVLVPLDGVYEVRKDRPHVWLQRACAWVLEKLGAKYEQSREMVERRRIRPSSVIEQIYLQRREVLETLGCGGETLIIGGNDYGQLMREPSINQYLEFRAEYNMGRQIMGLKVIVVPWMSGMVVIP